MKYDVPSGNPGYHGAITTWVTMIFICQVTPYLSCIFLSFLRDFLMKSNRFVQVRNISIVLVKDITVYRDHYNALGHPRSHMVRTFYLKNKTN